MSNIKEQILSHSINSSENTMDVSDLIKCNVIVVGLLDNNGLTSYNIDLNADGIYPFFNGVDKGHVLYNFALKQIEIVGDIKVYVTGIIV